MQTEISFLGHVISKDGVSTDPAKIEAVKKWPIPTRFLNRVGKKGIGTAAPIYFLLCPSTFEFAHPGFSVLGGLMCIVAHPNH